MTFQRDLAWQHLNHTYKSSISYHFARYALTLNYSLLPANVVHQAKRCLLDALGVAIGAYEAPGRLVMEKSIKEMGGPEEATLFCTGMRTSALNAALSNSFLIRFLDYNDKGGGGHNSECVASIMAAAEREKASGKDFLASIVISYELGARFSDSFKHSPEEMGLSPDMRAAFNQSPALGKMMGLNEEQIANAICIAGSHTMPMGILDADRDENSMSKNIRFGWAAHDALLACILARNGFTGPIRIFESERGIARTIGQGEMDFEVLTDFSGWRILNIWHKALPFNGSSHPHLFATLGVVKEHKVKPDDVAEVHLKVGLRESRHTTFSAKKYPRNAESADHSAFFGNAIIIRDGAMRVDAMEPKNFTDPVILDLIEKITVQHDPALGRYQATCEIVTKDGRRLKKSIDGVHGQGKSPMSDKELEEKFREMASKHMDEAQIRKIFDVCWNIEKQDNVSQLAKLMVFPGSK